MNYWSSFLFPWLMGLWLLLSGARRCHLPNQGGRALLAWGAAAAALVLVPVRGLPIGRWFCVLNFQAGVPLTGLLAGHLWKMTMQREIFRPNELRTAWNFGLVFGVVLYPSALGVGNFDVYQWGWGFSPLMLVVAVFAIVLAATGNRFSWLLVLSLLAWDARCFETTNLWDFLVDPIFTITAFAATVWGGPARRCRADRPRTHSKSRNPPANQPGIGRAWDDERGI